MLKFLFNHQRQTSRGPGPGAQKRASSDPAAKNSPMSADPSSLSSSDRHDHDHLDAQATTPQNHNKESFPRQDETTRAQFYDGIGLGRPQSTIKAAYGRSSSAPELTGHLAPLLGPVCGVVTTKTTRKILERLLAAQLQVSSGQPKDQLAARFDVAHARQALLRRDLPQQGAIEDLAATPVERVFESILADEIIQKMPVQALLPMQHLARFMAQHLQQLDPARAERVVLALVEDLRKEHPRPWSPMEPLLWVLCEGNGTWQDKHAAIQTFLRHDLQHGIDGLAAMVIIRSSFLALKSAGLDTTVAPWLKQADRHYVSAILPSKVGRAYLTDASGVGGDKMAGITNLGQKSALDIQHLSKGVRATYRQMMNLEAEDTRKSIAFGNPVAAGPSGTANMFLHAASAYNGRTQDEPINGAALALTIAALTCYDGGHSINEVFAVAHELRDLPNLRLEPFVGYTPGHARGIFVDLAKRLGAENIDDTAFERFERHYRKEPLEG